MYGTLRNVHYFKCPVKTVLEVEEGSTRRSAFKKIPLAPTVVVRYAPFSRPGRPAGPALEIYTLAIRSCDA